MRLIAADVVPRLVLLFLFPAFAAFDAGTVTSSGSGKAPYKFTLMMMMMIFCLWS